MPRSSKLPVNVSCFTHTLTAFWHVTATLPNFELGSLVSEKDYDSFFRVGLKTEATEDHVQQDKSATVVGVTFLDLILAMRATYSAHSSLADLLTWACPSATNTNACLVPINITIYCGLFNQRFYTFSYLLFNISVCLNFDRCPYVIVSVAGVFNKTVRSSRHVTSLGSCYFLRRKSPAWTEAGAVLRLLDHTHQLGLLWAGDQQDN